MTSKLQIKKYRDLNDYIKTLEKKLDKLEIDFDFEMRHYRGKYGRQFNSRLIEEYKNEEIEQLKKEKIKYLKITKSILNEIEKIENPLLKNVVMLKVIEGQPMKNISKRLNYSENYLYRIFEEYIRNT